MIIAEDNHRCEKCKIYERAQRRGGCCIWYMDNIVCGNDNVSNCPNFTPLHIEKK